MAVDKSGEVVCAGSAEPFRVCVWSVQTGRLTDVLTGHLGPVASLAFHPVRGSLVSGGFFVSDVCECICRPRHEN